MPSALIRLSGEIDMPAFPALSDAADLLSTAAPASAVIDLAAMTSACAALPNFVARLRHGLPPHHEHPVRIARDRHGQIAALRAELPDLDRLQRHRAVRLH